ncbi:MAG: hypothetical protein HUJ66_00335 [Oscillospiraceae bacterium]|nr:hypothetical protein [Oscillospiraceae bacterium]
MAYTITDKCKGCDDCVKVCRLKAISGEMKQKHVIDPAACNDCGDCRHICEYEAMLDEKGKKCKYIPKDGGEKKSVFKRLLKK